MILQLFESGGIGPTLAHEVGIQRVPSACDVVQVLASTRCKNA